MPSIRLDNVGLRFRVRPAGRASIKDLFVRGKELERTNPLTTVDALDGVDLAVDSGERIGVIGPNGAGKSTLLRLLAGVYPPTSGRRMVEGKICSLFDLSAGFEPEATGWENIRLRGYLQGETPRTLENKLPEIADFSGLGRFLDAPIRHYSSGMRVRLAFAVATAVDPEILLLDEVLSAGDREFQAKAQARIDDLVAKAKLMVLVSHDLESIARLCDRGVWMERGAVRMIGPARKVVDRYCETSTPTIRLQAS
jgi:ABC-type polysaccharide/polyol phosphate transport system ATPase subunit